jgi:predicted double-glycine peptidase
MDLQAENADAVYLSDPDLREIHDAHRANFADVFQEIVSDVKAFIRSLGNEKKS